MLKHKCHCHSLSLLDVRRRANACVFKSLEYRDCHLRLSNSPVQIFESKLVASLVGASDVCGYVYFNTCANLSMRHVDGHRKGFIFYRNYTTHKL